MFHFDKTGNQHSNKISESAIIRCARYAFAPNYYHYCGPDKNRTIHDYINGSAVDEGLIREIKEFHVLYPYLLHIAHANSLKDPFDPRVVEAYWIGNSLLGTIPLAQTIKHLIIDQKLLKKLPKKSIRWIVDTIPNGAKLHHSFHVFTVFMRTGHHAVPHTIETMDECRIGWGKIIKFEIRNSKFEIQSQKLHYTNGKLLFVPAIREVSIPFGDKENYTVGDWVTYHWGMVCEKVKERDIERLSFVTRHNLRLANEII